MNEERDMTDEELMDIAQQLFPETNPQEILEGIQAMKAESPGITNSDIVNMVVHTVIDKRGGNSKRMPALREKLLNR